MITLFDYETDAEYFDRQKEKIRLLIRTLTKEDFEQAGIAAMADDLAEKNKVRELAVNITVPPQKPTNGGEEKEIYFIPVKGNLELLFVKPSLREEMTFAEQLDKENNVLLIALDKHSAYDANQRQALMQNVEQINRDVQEFNASLMEYIEEQLEKQKVFLRAMERGNL